MKSAKKLLTRCWDERTGQLDDELWTRGVLQHRNTPGRSGRSPAQIVFVRPIRNTLPAHRRNFAPEWQRAADIAEAQVTRDQEKVEDAYRLEAIALHPDRDCTIFSDGSAKAGTTCGGGGALIELHHENRTIECTVPAGKVCSSLRAELAAMAEALRTVIQLPETSRAHIKSLLLCTDSLSGLQLLNRGPDSQQMALAQEVCGPSYPLSRTGGVG